jgi:hypothetical protein
MSLNLFSPPSFEIFVISSTFFYEDGQENVHNEQGQKGSDPMMSTEITNPIVVLESAGLAKEFFLFSYCY